MAKLKNINNKLFNKANLDRIFKAGMLGLVLAGNVACKQPLQTVIPENTLGTPIERPNYEYGTPYTKTLGNGNYSIRNFIGEEEIGSGRTMLEDVNYYLDKAETHIQSELNDFEKSLKDRPAAQSFFNRYLTEQKSNHNYSIPQQYASGNDFDYLIKNMFTANKKIYNKIAANLTEQDANNFEACCLALEAESYYLGLGKKRSETQFLNKYNEMHSKARFKWIKNNETIPFNLDDDIQQQNCHQITQTMDRILRTAAGNMEGVNLADLQKWTKIMFYQKSLQGLHDISAEKLSHRDQCIDQTK